jgi:hypothetical protein
MLWSLPSQQLQDVQLSAYIWRICARPLNGVDTPIDEQFHAGHKAGGIRSEENGHPGNLTAFSNSPKRRHVRHILPNVFVGAERCRITRGMDRPRADHVDAWTSSPQFRCQSGYARSSERQPWLPRRPTSRPEWALILNRKIKRFVIQSQYWLAKIWFSLRKRVTL